MMHVLKNWRAKRAGGLITVYGERADGTQAKIVGVDHVTPGPRDCGYCVAVDKNGNTHQLVMN